MQQVLTHLFIIQTLHWLTCLELGSKYYVGQSANKRQRIQQHREGEDGSEFTTRYAVVEELEPLTEPQTDLNQWELKETLIRMRKHGIHNVRGSRWCQLVLQQCHIVDIKGYMVACLLPSSLTHSLTHSLARSLTYALTSLRRRQFLAFATTASVIRTSKTNVPILRSISCN